MLKCVHCGSETFLRVSGIPVCVNCDVSPEKTLKLLEANFGLRAARLRWKAAKSGLDKAAEIVTSLPHGHPDGTQALRKANSVLAKAREELQAALGAYLQVTKLGKKE